MPGCSLVTLKKRSTTFSRRFRAITLAENGGFELIWQIA
jgi:hypothetical protein